MKYYSQLTSGFYDSDIHTILPEDVLELTEEQYNTLFNGQSIHKTIKVVNDIPQLVDRTYTQEQLLELEINKAKRYLRETDYMMTSDYDKDITEVKIKRAEARALIREYESN